jgi:hypothetical protein
MLEISLHGEQRVAVDGSTAVALGLPRAMTAPGFLLLHRDAPQRREFAAAQFWRDFYIRQGAAQSARDQNGCL